MDAVQYVTGMNYLLADRHSEAGKKSGREYERWLGRDHGYLDSPLLLSYGYDDRYGGALFLDPGMLLREELFCERRAASGERV
jgi:hypothetical protein